MDNVIKAYFYSGNIARTNTVFQYNRGMILKFMDVDLPATYRVDFANSLTGQSKTCVGTADGVIVPLEMMAKGCTVYAWAVIANEDSTVTVYQAMIPISPRAEPTDEAPNAEQQQVIDQLIAAMNQAVEQTGADVESANVAAAAAADSADVAAASEAAAAASEQAAAASETAAAGSASSASADAATASSAASAAIQEASDAAARAQAAAASEAAAAASEQAAKASENAAAGSASDASADAATAASAARTATQQAGIATSGAETATQKAADAADSAQDAASSETAATGSAAAAAISETNAGAAETAAQTAQAAAEAAARSVSESAAQIEENKEDIADLKSALNSLVEDVNSQSIWSQGRLNVGSGGGSIVEDTKAITTTDMITDNVSVTLVDNTCKFTIAVYSSANAWLGFLRYENDAYSLNYYNGTNFTAISYSEISSEYPSCKIRIMVQKASTSATISVSEYAAVSITKTDIPSPYTSNPDMDGTASPGVSGNYARGDHVHPHDISKADKTSYLTLSGTTVTQTGEDNTMYLCGELAELTFAAPMTGQTAIRFSSGTTPTVVTLTGITMPEDWTGAEANKTYEINVLNGLGVYQSWT